MLTFAALSCAAGESNRLSQIVVVFKTHFDIGYTDMATNVVQRYRTTMIDQALEVVDQNRDLPPEQQFVWTRLRLADAQDPPGLARAIAATQGARGDRPSGKGGSSSTACRSTTHTELLEAEDLVRSLGYSARLDPAPRAGPAARWQDDRCAGAHLDDGHAAEARRH